MSLGGLILIYGEQIILILYGDYEKLKNLGAHVQVLITKNIRQPGSSSQRKARADDREEAPSGGHYRTPGLADLPGFRTRSVKSVSSTYFSQKC